MSFLIRCNQCFHTSHLITCLLWSQLISAFTLSCIHFMICLHFYFIYTSCLRSPEARLFIFSSQALGGITSKLKVTSRRKQCVVKIITQFKYVFLLETKAQSSSQLISSWKEDSLKHIHTRVNLC